MDVLIFINRPDTVYKNSIVVSAENREKQPAYIVSERDEMARMHASINDQGLPVADVDDSSQPTQEESAVVPVSGDNEQQSRHVRAR